MDDSEFIADGVLDQFGHISESGLSGFLDNDLSPAERRQVEAHLDACAQCLSEMLEVRRVASLLKRSDGRKSARYWPRVAIGGALAAGIAAVMLLPRTDRESVPLNSPVRAQPSTGGREGQVRIDVVSPLGDAAVASSRVVFVWRATAADLYRLTMLTESGEPLWLLETSDTSAVVPADKRLKPGVYFWRVDAIKDGIAATTGGHQLRVSP